MIFIIIVSSILISFENPLDDPKSKKSNFLKNIDSTFSCVFAFESLLKIVSCGLILNGPTSYLKVPWNILDFTIVILSLLSMSFSHIDIGMFKVLRLIKVLRPLRMISRNQGLQISIVALFQSVPNIINVLLISLIFFFIFGILGVS